MAGLTYKDAGVDKDAGYKEVELIKKLVGKTHGPEVLADVGGFAGAFMPDLAGIENPVLVSGTDGVGTKIKLAMDMDKHDTVGIDAVAMCINDILCVGARPLFFLDYIATGKLNPQKMADIVKGVADGCTEAEAALIGGETAEMPGIYQEEDYDIAGFAVGLVDRNKMISGENLKEGDLAIGIKSSGVHSNGFSLVRAAMDRAGVSLDDDFDGNQTIGEKLLTPTRIYAMEVKALIETVDVKAISHITGGGLYENIPRVLSDDLGVDFDLSDHKPDQIFSKIQEWGDIETEEMYHTFNMGYGLVVFVEPAEESKVLEIVGEDAKTIGKVVAGNKEIKINL